MPETITIHPYALLSIGFFVLAASIWISSYAATRIGRRLKRRAEVRIAEQQIWEEGQKRRKEEQKKEERTKLAELLPQPWFDAYEECKAAGVTVFGQYGSKHG